MEDLGSLWRFQENVEDLKQKLLQKTFELESLKMEASEESIKNKEKVKSLLLLLQAAYEERDEARDQLQKLMNKIMPTTATELPALLHFQPESPLNIPTKANSSITESNSLYETYNHHSYGSSPADSFFDGVSSPDFSTQKGKLLQAVTEAGPLLQTLLVAGPLPQWRNPPPLQTFKIPPLLVNGCNTKNINQNPSSKASSSSPKPLHSLLHAEMSSRGSSQICSASSTLSFTNGPSGSCINSALMMAPNVNHTQIMPSSPPPPSPVPDYSSWSPWSISTIVIVCVIFLLLSNYRLLKQLCRVLHELFSGRPAVQFEENPNNPSLQIHAHGLETSMIRLQIVIIRFIVLVSMPGSVIIRVALSADCKSGVSLLLILLQQCWKRLEEKIFYEKE